MILCGNSQKGYDAELIALDILEKEGYEIVYSAEKLKRERENNPKFHSASEWVELQNKLENLGYGVYFVDKSLGVKTQLDKNELLPFPDRSRPKLTKVQKNMCDKLIGIWNDWNDVRNQKMDNTISNRKLLTKILGKQTMSKNTKKIMIEKLERSKIGVRINQMWIKQIKNDEYLHHTFVDILCKKGKSYYMFDVKHKTFKENKNMNRFYVTNNEVLNFNRIAKESKAKVKILIILEKGKKLFYKIFDWNEFIVPNRFDPDEYSKTGVRLAKGFDISSLKEV